MRVKAWARVTQAGAFVKSHGFASCTRTAVGRYTLAFINAQPDTNYGVLVNSPLHSISSAAIDGFTTSGFQVGIAVPNTLAALDYPFTVVVI